LSEELTERLFSYTRNFFALPVDEKMKVHLERSGHSWRGYFGLGEQKSAKKTDMHEGYYFGFEHD
jgi:isopenicillin N synthase-like dioxygenase